MTALTHRPAVSSASSQPLSGVLADQIAEAVAFPPDPHTRSSVIATLTAEIFETVRWLHGSDPDPEELASLYRVLAEAYAHRSRMATRATAGQRS